MKKIFEERAKAQSIDDFLNLKETAAILGYSASYLRNLTGRKTIGIPFFKPRGGKILFRRSDVEAFILKSEVGV
jgi:excisionase family DNA binding protein